MRTRVGYTGGTKKDPTYHDLGDHTETLQVDFDPSQVSYETLLDMFWMGHNPTRRTRSQQYKAAVFVHDDQQRRLAEATRDQIAEQVEAEITTEILDAEKFYTAEDYHQKYYLRQESDLMREFKEMFSSPAEFRDSTAAARVNGYVGGNGTQGQLEEDLGRLGLSEAGQRKLQSFGQRLRESRAET